MAQPKKMVRVLFDETHSESWSVSRARAAQMNPDDPDASSYEKAAKALEARDFVITRNLEHPLHSELLHQTDILVLLHPCDAKWEKTTSGGSPRLTSRELRDVREFVHNGGSLIVVTEYEHEKYGDNLNELLKPFGMTFENTTVSDRSACHHDNATWFFGVPDPAASDLAHFVHKACFYRAGSCRLSGDARAVWRSSAQAHPADAVLMARTVVGEGRVLALADSSLFGDAHFDEFNHRQLWLNVCYWAAVRSFTTAKFEMAPSVPAQSPAWKELKSAVETLRELQNPDATVPEPEHGKAGELVGKIQRSLQQLAPSFPHQDAYFKQLHQDLEQWRGGRFAKPDFAKSLGAFNPQNHRRHLIENLVLFPLYTPNASKDVRFEAMIFRVPWPDWLDEMERTRYGNNKFVPGNLVDFTRGYDSECAVLFPETVSVSKMPTNNFGVIFCDREARRLQRYAREAAEATHLELHPQLECWLGSLEMIQNTMELWDLIHDRAHGLGELPFDPFMIRQRAPFWMYGLEELRVDLRTFGEAVRLRDEGFPFAHYITYAILFDRIFRFPIVGSRVRNYDGLAGQLLFAYLHKHDVLVWRDNELEVRWDLLPNGIAGLREEVTRLYKDGADCSKMSFWIAAHDLISPYVKPNVGSKWKQEGRVISDEKDLKHWVDLVESDEFPLGNFHVNLLKHMAVASGK